MTGDDELPTWGFQTGYQTSNISFLGQGNNSFSMPFHYSKGVWISILHFSYIFEVWEYLNS